MDNATDLFGSVDFMKDLASWAGDLAKLLKLAQDTFNL